MREAGMSNLSGQSLKAYETLRDMILANQLTPGSNHLETELAASLGMSRTPVREACLILENQGLVDVVPRRGVRIAPVSASDMAEIYAILTELESHAAYEVAARRPSELDLAPLRSHLDEMVASLEATDLRRWAKADDLFHRQLVAMANNRRLQTVVGMFADQVHRARMLTLFIRPAPHKSNDDHRRLYAALLDGDAERAREIHREHRQNAKNALLDLISRYGFSAL